MATLVILMHEDRKKYGLLKIRLEFCESHIRCLWIWSWALRSEDTNPNASSASSNVIYLLFFSSLPLGSSAQCTQSPWVYPPHPQPVLCIGTFCVPPFFCYSFTQTDSNTQRDILAFTISFHPAGTSGSLFWYQGNETLLAKRDFYKCIEIFPFRERSRKCRLKVNYSIFSLLSVLEAPKVFAGGHSECDHLVLEGSWCSSSALS